MGRMVWAAVALLPASMVGMACGGGSEGEPDAGDSGVMDAGLRGPVALFSPTAEAPLGWDAVPFPNDLFLGDDGTVELASVPGDGAMWQDVRERLGERRGFCRACPIHFPVRGSIDRAVLPGRPGPGDEASLDDPVLLVDVDPESPERGRLFPVEAEWNHGTELVSIRLRHGIALEPGRTYAGVLTSRVLSPDGHPVQPSPIFAEARDRDTGGSAEAQRTRAVVGPALDFLETLDGLAREDIVSLAVFTTMSTEETLAPLEGIVAALDSVYADGEPVAAFEPPSGEDECEGDRVWKSDDGSLDALLGTPSEAVPGLDVPAAAGTEGDVAIVHETAAVAVTGSFLAPRIVGGTGDDLGMLRTAADGSIEPGETHRVPFVLAVPDGADVTDLPVVVVHMGTGSDRQSGLLLMDTVGRAGAALLAIEPFLHGSRSSTATDELHDLRESEAGALGCDGFSEARGRQVALRAALALAGTESGQEGNPFYLAATRYQLASDTLAMLRLVSGGDWSAIASSDASLAGLSFDVDRLGFVGISRGSLVGQAVLAVDTQIDAAVLGVPAASSAAKLCEQPGAVRRNAVKGALGLTSRFDEQDEHLCMHPAMGLYAWVGEPVLPIGLARYVWTDRRAGGAPPDVLYQIASLDQIMGSANTEAVPALAGVPLGGAHDPAFAELATATAPLEANLEVGGEPVTAGAWRFGPANHAMPRRRSVTFEWNWPIYPPWQERDSPLEAENPTDAVHAQIEELFRSRFADGRATIVDPERL